MPAFPSKSCRILLAMLGPDPGDDFPDVILGPDDLAIGRHRPDNILGSPLGGLGRHLVMIVMMMMRTMAASTRSGGSFDRHAHQLAVTHAALGDDVLAEMLHLARLAAQHRDLEASVMVEMHMQRGERLSC